MSKALFANQRETNLASTVLLVEEVLADRDVVDACDLPGALRAWRIGKDATVSLINRSEFTHVRVQAAVLTIDAGADRQALYAELLDHNASLCGAAFATVDDRVMLVSERSTLDLDKSEVEELIGRVLGYASQLGPALHRRFGGKIT
jgi:hypothetical protein